MKKFIFLLPFLFLSPTSRAQNRVDVYICSYEIPGFGKLVDQYIERSWAQGQSMSDSQAELNRLAGSSQDCSSFKASLLALITSLPEIPRTEARPRPDNRRSQPEPRRDDEEDEQVEQQRQGRRAFRLPRIPRLPQWPQRERTSRNDRPRILVVTDEPSAYGAQTVQQSFATTAPWNCLGVEVVIEVMDREELGCQPRNDGRPRIVECAASASRKAQALRRRLGAKKVLIVVDSGMQGGNGGGTPVITTSFLQHSPKAGMHEIMHTMGFEDTYDRNAQYAATSGDIMSCTSENCFVLPQDWGRVARGLNMRLPQDCREN